MADPEGIETEMDGQNIIIVKGIDKEKVGQYAAEIRDKRNQNLTKVKVLSMLMKLSDVKLVRLVRNKGVI